MYKSYERSSVFYRGGLKRKYPVIVRGEGIYLFDNEGNKYIDAAGGIAVVNVGYGVEEVVEAMAKQAIDLQYAQTVFFTTEVQERLANKIIDFLSPKGLTKVWFSLSGTDSNETALKLARQYHVESGNPSKYKIISRQQSYHGGTIGALSMSSSQSWSQHYIPYLLNFPHIYPPYCYRCPVDKEYPGCNIHCAYELERAIKLEGSQYVSAFIAEPIITASAGVVIPPPEYFEIIRSICDKYNILFIADEVYTGIGRTGKNFGIDHWDIIPDIITIAKGIAGGYAPLGATIVSQKIYDAILNGSAKFVHGLTFSGHPVCCAASLAVLEYIEKNHLIQRSAEMGSYFLKKLSGLSDFPIVGDIRGKGLLIGIEFVRDKKTKALFEQDKKISTAILDSAFKKGLRILEGRGSFIMMAPPFVITESEIDQTVDILEKTITEVYEKISK